MKKGWIAAVAVCVALVAAFSWQGTVTAPEIHQQTELLPYRVVKAYHGRVAVFLPQSATPETVYDTALTSLPVEVQEALKKGVEVTNTSTLKELLDDILS